MIRAGALAIAILSSAASAAFAAPVDLSGRWSFTSNVGAGEGCRFGGTATVTPTENTDQFEATLVAEHNCPDYYHFIVEQSADLRVTGKQVSVLSTIKDIVKQDTKPGWEDYAPDNFALTLQSDGHLFGSLNGRGVARWVRQEEGIS